MKNKSNTHQRLLSEQRRSTPHTRDQLDTQEINSTHSGPTLDVRVASRWLTKHSSPKAHKITLQSRTWWKTRAAFIVYIAVYVSGLQQLALDKIYHSPENLHLKI